MVKAIKTKTLALSATKKNPRTKVSPAIALKKEFKAKTAELKKQFDKQLKEVKTAAHAKAVAAATEVMTKHEMAKSKAVKEALSTIEKARALKIKMDKAANKELKAPKATVKKSVKVIKTAKVSRKK